MIEFWILMVLIAIEVILIIKFSNISDELKCIRHAMIDDANLNEINDKLYKILGQLDEINRRRNDNKRRMESTLQ